MNNTQVGDRSVLLWAGESPMILATAVFAATVVAAVEEGAKKLVDFPLTRMM